MRYRGRKLSKGAFDRQDGRAMAWSQAGLMIAMPAGMGMGTVAEWKRSVGASVVSGMDELDQGKNE